MKTCICQLCSTISLVTQMLEGRFCRKHFSAGKQILRVEAEIKRAEEVKQVQISAQKKLQREVSEGFGPRGGKVGSGLKRLAQADADKKSREEEIRRINRDLVDLARGRKEWLDHLREMDRAAEQMVPAWESPIWEGPEFCEEEVRAS